MAQTQRPLINKTAIEYDTMRQQLIDLIPSLTPYWTEYHDTDPGVVILTLFAAIADMLGFYLDKRTNELVLTRATMKQSVIDIGRMFDYRLRRITAATVPIQITLKQGETIPENVAIPNYLKVATEDGTPYITKEALTFLTNDTEKETTAYQGRVYEEIFTSDGADVQTYALQRKNVASNFLEVYVNDVLWDEDTFEPPHADTFYKYYVDTDQNSKSSIVFNRFRYEVPPNLATVRVVYVATDGPAGEIQIGAISDIETATGTTTWEAHYDKFQVANDTASTGSALEEDYTTIKRKIPSYLSALWRAVTIQDYKDLAITYAGVLSANAIHHPTDRFRAVVYIQAESNTAALCAPVQTFLDSLSVLGCSSLVEAATQVAINISVDIELYSREITSVVRANLEAAFNTYFDIHTMQIGQTVPLDDIYALIDEVSGVNYAKVTKLSRTGSGIGHIVLADNEFPILGTLVLNLTGGLA